MIPPVETLTYGNRLSRFRHAQEQQFQQHFSYTAAAAAERDVVAASQYMTRGGPVPQAAPAPPPPHQQGPPKRPKLGLEPRPELTQPLRIDTDIKRVCLGCLYNPSCNLVFVGLFLILGIVLFFPYFKNSI